eukprot:15087766-Ditylum_brightwellii.AAC.1
MQTLKKGLHHHHSPCRTIQMQKADDTRAITDDENAQVFCEHFSKFFNNQNPLPCDHSALELIPPHDDFTHLAELPSLTEVRAALCRMVNGKAPRPSGITSNALKSMVGRRPHWMMKGLMTMPTTWPPVPKKGDLSNPNKWHPVCLLETTYK